MTSFQTAAGVLGGLLVVGALLSGVARRSILSLASVYVLAGFMLGDGAAGVLHFRADSGLVSDLATVALIVILFRDGLEVDAELLQKQWHVPLRKLVIGMPVTCGVVAVTTHAFSGLTWTEAFLVGALLSPTDPVLSSGIVTDGRVPRFIRHSLNLESGLNDGLALPAVLAFAAALDPASHGFVWWRFVLQDVGLGLIYGVACGWIGSLLMPAADRLGLGRQIPSHQKALYVLGVAFATYSATVVEPHGNGFIAVFVAAIVLGLRRPDLRHHFALGAEPIVEVVKLGIFAVFGSLLTIDALFTDGWEAIAVVGVTFIVARPLAVWLALARTSINAPAKTFMAWFGPKGVSTMAFATLVLARHVTAGERIFNLAALGVVFSILAHGLTERPGIDWLARGRRDPEARETAPSPAPP